MDVQLRFDDRVAIVTGAGRGMGRAHALLLGARGARIVVNDLPGDDDPAARVVEEITARHGIATASTDDISTPAGGKALVQRAVDAFGRVDIVVNNAGVIRLGPVEDLTVGRLEQTMKVNAYGALYVTQAAWRFFRERRYGRVVMVSSSAGLFGLPDRVDYAASKGAMVGMTRALASEAHGTGVRVNALFPTAITRISSLPVRQRVAKRLGVSDRDEDLAALMEHSTALVSPMVAWLSHEECSVNGEIFESGGGHTGRILIGAARGYDDPEVTAERVRDHLEEILAADGFEVRPNYSVRASAVNASEPDPRT